MDDHTFEWTIPATLRDASKLRRAFRTWLIDEELSPIEVDRWELAFSELIANACAASPPGASVSVLVRCVGPRVTLKMTNRSDGRSIPRVATGATPVDRGRGLLIVDQLLDGLVFTTDEGHTVATAWAITSDDDPAGT